MRRAELMALREAATPGVGRPDHDARWEEFSTAAWHLLPSIFEEMDRLREHRKVAVGIEDVLNDFEDMLSTPAQLRDAEAAR